MTKVRYYFYQTVGVNPLECLRSWNSHPMYQVKRGLSIRFVCLLWGLIIINCTLLVYAQTLEELESLTNERFTFLSNTLGARAKGLGTAFVAIADDGSAIANNPAGIAQIRASQLNVNRPLSNLGKSTEGLFIYVQPVGERQSVGASIYSNHPSGDNIPEGNLEQIFNVAYAWQLEADSKIYVGLGGKVFSKDGPISFNGVALDLGIFAQPIGQNIILGLVGQNFGPDVKLNYNSGLLQSFVEADITPPVQREIPFNFRFGMAYHSQIFTFPYRVAAQVDKSTLSSFVRGSIGAEILFGNMLTMRGGYTAESEAGQDSSLGMGIRFHLMKIGYTYINREHHDNRHEAYLIIDFPSQVPKRRRTPSTTSLFPTVFR